MVTYLPMYKAKCLSAPAAASPWKSEKTPLGCIEAVTCRFVQLLIPTHVCNPLYSPLLVFAHLSSFSRNFLEVANSHQRLLLPPPLSRYARDNGHVSSWHFPPPRTYRYLGPYR